MFKRAILSLALFAGACAAQPTPEPQAVVAKPAAAKTLTITDASFSCIRDLKPVRGYYVGNLLGNVDATVAVAMKGEGGDYPAGSVVQLVPGEAMVKHPPGFN